MTYKELDSLIDELDSLRIALKESEAGELRNALAVGRAVLELQEDRKELDSLRAANARLQAWHDAVMGQETIGFEIVFKTGRWLKYDYKGYSPETKSELIIRPQPLAKE